MKTWRLLRIGEQSSRRLIGIRCFQPARKIQPSPRRRSDLNLIVLPVMPRNENLAAAENRRAEFATTDWNTVLSAGAEDSTLAQAALRSEFNSSSRYAAK